MTTRGRALGACRVDMLRHRARAMGMDDGHGARRIGKAYRHRKPDAVS